MPKRLLRSLSIACFGEVLWDLLPRGIFLGGAPLNVAYHLSRQGVRAMPVSAVGRGFLGLEAIRRITAWGLDVRYLAHRPDRPTGTVRATLDAAGAATYQIAQDVAWDRIAVPRALLHQPAPAALVIQLAALLGGLVGLMAGVWSRRDSSLREQTHPDSGRGSGPPPESR